MIPLTTTLMLSAAAVCLYWVARLQRERREERKAKIAQAINWNRNPAAG